MIVMPACSSGWFWHCLARETGKLGHLYSPGAQRGPWPWLPYALDNGAFSCWNPTDNSFNDDKWDKNESEWRRLLMWAQCTRQRPRWAIVPDRPGSREETIIRWSIYAGIVEQSGIPLAVAVQDGMTSDDVIALDPLPEVIAIGGSTEWKWETVAQWAADFPRVHLLRCNSPTKLYELEAMGVESCDGSGWNRGDKKQTSGLEEWARFSASQNTHQPALHMLHPFVCKEPRDKMQITFA